MSVYLYDILDFISKKNPHVSYFVNSNDNPIINNVSSDSRFLPENTLFCCIKGQKSDGHNFAEFAQQNGAKALLCERKIDNIKIPQIVVKSVRDFLGEVAALVYDFPANKLLMVGVTGTNGKTTTTYIIRSILQAAGIRTGLLGTIIESDGVNEIDADRTTPESSIVQRQLFSMVKNNCGACVMETSSHGLFLGRLKGILYDVPVFTNLYPEHLDFHIDMENYFEAKKLLFTNYSKQNFIGAANFDDTYGKRLLNEFPTEKLRGFGLSEGAFSRAVDFKTDLSGTHLKIIMQNHKDLILNSPLVGDFNIMNTLCAVTAIRERVDDDAIIKGVASVPQVPGRLERIDLPNGAKCFVDFAHTPSALETVLKTINKLAGENHGKIISVFGHGGGRYHPNRPELGKAASKFADEIIITNDNPRDENPADIAKMISQGVTKPYEIILNREEAVIHALEKLNSNDILVVTGKGPEKFLIFENNRQVPYNDSQTIKDWCNK